ncbi:hypothetical protein RM780_21390 [Streptomyces sp. DSM 44917]|uniref:Uncharacterized protein n=1 Tax=Streptomyces boetiae TaxID=3075541 RepID=A0ABU2LDY7_9ACTN|nr:hypothetical protein [Streptomyces sp. DSM 44917]MDT0309493.1 hypothetical protein [Streptomyces sp. DSM 44917]
MTDWEFTLVLNRQLTDDDAEVLAVTDDPLFADGSVSYTVGGDEPCRCACNVEAPTVLEAVARASASVRGVLPGLYPVRVENGAAVTLAEAAERAHRTPQELSDLAESGGGLPEPLWVTEGAATYSWPGIVAVLRAAGVEVANAPRGLRAADLLVRAAAEATALGVPASVLELLTGWRLRED